ncbi:MAG: SCO family protein, partial [Bdellovibrionales bacterium]|nr:SCO family protein [Bdellovibrionales bacterium]
MWLVPKKVHLLTSLALLCGALCSSSAFSYDPSEQVVTGHEVPPEFKDVGIKEKLGGKIDFSIPFVADTGESVHLGDYFSGTKPVLLSIVYFGCPSLCNYHLNGVTDALKKVDLTPGKDFEIVAVSMNHRETSELAAKKKANYVKEYGRPESLNGWHFLTGTEENIKKLAD